MFEKLSKEDKLAYKLWAVLFSFILIIAISMAVAFATKGPGYNKVNLCQNNVQRPAHNIFLVDTTDSMSEEQSRELNSRIDTLISESEVDTRYTVFVISEKFGGLSDVMFDMCQPDNGKNANFLTENAKFMHKRFKEKFEQPLKEFIDTLAKHKPKNTSPLVESVSDIFSLNAFDKMAKNHNLYIFSDLIQNSAKYSFFKGHGLPGVGTCEKQPPINLIEAGVLERPDFTKMQLEKVPKEWAGYLKDCTNKLKFVKMRY